MKRTPRGESESVIALTELLKMKENGQFPGGSVKVEGTQIRSVSVSLCQLLLVRVVVYPSY